MVLAALALGIVTPLCAIPLILISVLTSSDAPAWHIARVWALVTRKFMGLTFSIQGSEKVVPGVSYIVTPNHQSNTDILALIVTLPLRFRWVVKRELLRIPFFGWALGRTGAISLDRSNPREAVQKLNAAKDKLKGGWSVLIYPEGTRSPDANLLPFKKGPFMLAVQTGIPILPVTCNGAFRIMPKRNLWLRPGHITVTISDPIATKGLTESDVPELMDRTRKAIERNLDPSYDPFDRKRSLAEAH